MKFIAILCLALLVTANDYELLSELTQYEFGKTILATMQISLSNENFAIDEVVTQLKSMQTNAQNDLKETQQEITHRQEECDLRIDEVQQVIDNASAKKAEDENAFPLRQDELIAKNQQLKDKVGFEKSIQDRLLSLEKQREEEKQQFQDKQTQNNEFIQGLKKAKGIVSQLNSSFIQVSNMKEKLHKHLETLNNKNTPYNGLVKMLIAAAGDENVSKIVQIIDELIESLQHLSKTDEQGQKEKHQLYLLQKARYELESQTLQSNLADLQADAERLRQSLLELKNDIESKTQLLSVKNQQLNDWQKTCSDELRSHQNIRQLKNNELNIINECIEIFTGRFNDGIKSYIQKLEI